MKQKFFVWYNANIVHHGYQIHPLSYSQPLPHVPARLTPRGALVAHSTCLRLLAVELLRTFVPLSVSMWNELDDPVFDDVGLVGFKSRANAFLLA